MSASMDFPGRGENPLSFCLPAPPAVGHDAHRAFPENNLIYPRLNVKVLLKLFHAYGGRVALWGFFKKDLTVRAKT